MNKSVRNYFSYTFSFIMIFLLLLWSTGCGGGGSPKKSPSRSDWTFGTGGPIESSPIIASDGTIYVGSNDGIVYQINPDGTPGWTFNAGGTISSSPAMDGSGIIYIGTTAGDLYAIDSTTGTAVWGSPFLGCSFANSVLRDCAQDFEKYFFALIIKLLTSRKMFCY